MKLEAGNIQKETTEKEWYAMLGIPAPPCADRGCTDSCSSEGKAH